MSSKITEMSPADKRNQLTITLSEQAFSDYSEVAEYLGMPLATLLRQKLEEVHQSPSFGALIRRAQETRSPEEKEQD